MHVVVVVVVSGSERPPTLKGNDWEHVEGVEPSSAT